VVVSEISIEKGEATDFEKIPRVKSCNEQKNQKISKF
jgi:hypothetical protein